MTLDGPSPAPYRLRRLDSSAARHDCPQLRHDPLPSRPPLNNPERQTERDRDRPTPFTRPSPLDDSPLDDFHSLLLTLRSARAFISTAPRPSLLGAWGKNSLLLPPRGGGAGDIYRPKSGPHFTSTLTPGSNRPSPVPKRGKARKGGGEIPGVLLELLLS